MNKDDFIKMMENGYNSLVREETLEEKSFRLGYTYALNDLFHIIVNNDKEIEIQNKKYNKLYVEDTKRLNEKDKEIERLKSNEKTLADLLDKEQKKNKKAIEYNKQKIEDIKTFYRPTKDTIYSGDTIIDIAKLNIEILKGDENNEQ